MSQNIHLEMTDPIIISLLLGLCGCFIIYLDSRITHKKREAVFYYKIYVILVAFIYIGISIVTNSKKQTKVLSGLNTQRIMTGTPNF